MIETGIGVWIACNALLVLVLTAASWVKPKPQRSEETRIIDVTRLLRGAARIERVQRSASLPPRLIGRD